MVALVDAIAGSLPLPVLCYLLVSARLGRDPQALGSHVAAFEACCSFWNPGLLLGPSEEDGAESCSIVSPCRLGRYVAQHDPSSRSFTRRRFAKPNLCHIGSDPEISLVEQLREKHDTTVYRFDQSQRPISIASFLKQSPLKEDGGSLDTNVDSWWLAATVAWVGSLIGMVGLLSLAIGILGRWFSAKAHSFAYFVLTGAVCLIASMVFIATASLRASEYPLASLWSKTKPEKTSPVVSNQEPERTTARPSPRDVAWGELLTANGSERD